MTQEEAKEYLSSYKDYANRFEYIENKVLNIHSYDYQTVRGSNGTHKNQNDYIQIKDHCLQEMAEIRADIDKVGKSAYREVLFYKYCELMNVYDIADLMGYSIGTVRKLFWLATKEFAKVMTTGE